MPLPSNFDPRRLTLDVPQAVRRIAPTPIHVPPSPSRSYSRSWWSALNDGVASIGEWIHETGASVAALIITAIPALAGVVGLISWTISVFADNGFFLGLFSLVADYFVVVIGYYVCLFVFGLLYYIFLLFGYVFYNIYTLLITLAIVLFLCFRSSSPSGSQASTYITMEQAKLTTTYVCTARPSLKVRRNPTHKSDQIGSIMYGEEIEVIDFVRGFAHFKYHGGEDAYASQNYLRKK